MYVVGGSPQQIQFIFSSFERIIFQQTQLWDWKTTTQAMREYGLSP